MNAAAVNSTFETDRTVLSHVGRYGLTVVEALCRLAPFRGCEQQEASGALERLEATGTIRSTWLYRGKRCYCLPARKPPHHALPERGKPSLPLSEESKIRRFAMLSFCCLGEIARVCLTAAEIASRLSTQHGAQAADNYYLQPEPRQVFGFLRVDMGGNGRWDRILAKCCEDAREHASQPAWQALIRSEQFEITLATALPQKAERLCRALREMPKPPHVQIRVTAIPELLYLIAPPAE